MFKHDIVYFKGNPNSGNIILHQQINFNILQLIKPYSFICLNSKYNNLSNMDIPKAKIYIGFSRGSRYLKKLDPNSLKISIGGISGSKIHLFKNRKDNILLGDISISSINAHFQIEKGDRKEIKDLIKNFMEK